MQDEIILARMMTALDLEFEKAMHYHDEGYGSDKGYGSLSLVMRPVYIYSAFATEASFNMPEYKLTPCTISPFMPRRPRSLPFCEGVCQCLTFHKTAPLTLERNSNDEEYLLSVDLDDQVWSEEPLLDSYEHLCIHKIPSPASSSPQPNQGVPATQQHIPINEYQQNHPYNLIK